MVRIRTATTKLYFEPAQQFVEAHIVPLTADMIDAGIHRGWWGDTVLKEPLEPPPIDRHWNRHEMGIEFEGKPIASEKLAIVTVRSGEPAVQGAMMLSTEPVPSALEPGGRALFVELLFTAPRNRPHLCVDEQSYLKGVGIELLTWAAWLSRASGNEGRIRLDGSPEYIAWYQRRGLQRIGASPIIYEAVAYTPMELVSAQANKLLDGWDAVIVEHEVPD
jgi:hypothetical protein